MDIFEEIWKSLQEEEQIMLATIISTTGSTRAAESSKTLIRNQGLTAVGTVGGGCLEGEVLTLDRSLYGTGKAKISTFHLDEDNADSELIRGCGVDALIMLVGRSLLPAVKSLVDSRCMAKTPLSHRFPNRKRNQSHSPWNGFRLPIHCDDVSGWFTGASFPPERRCTPLPCGHT